jgi:chemotaxis protein methyltransferase CheR
MSDNEISDQEFALFQRLIYKIAGISLSDAKKPLLIGRLARRLRHYNLGSFAQYYRLVNSGAHPGELQTMVDLLTTNETYFFREPAHFEFLKTTILPGRNSAKQFRIWSAASSSGEEAYSLAMVLAESLQQAPWEVVASDISTAVLARARAGHYPLERNEGIPPDLLKKYCLEGVRKQAGTFLVSSEIRQRVEFCQVNLTLPVPAKLGVFDVIFLRNVMIYFDMPTKQQVLDHLVPHLGPGGYLIIGHSETLNGVTHTLQTVRPTIYRRT